MASYWEYKRTPPRISLIDVFLDLQNQQAFKKLQISESDVFLSLFSLCLHSCALMLPYSVLQNFRVEVLIFALRFLHIICICIYVSYCHGSYTEGKR